MEYNKEIFETEDDYLFEMSTCVIHKILMENQPCTYSELLIFARKLLPNDMYSFLKEQICDVLTVGQIVGMIAHKHNVYAINESGINEFYFVMENINESHKKDINNISNTEIVINDNEKIVSLF